MPAPVVVIAASNLLPSLRERLAGKGELACFPDTEPIQALQAILEHKPSLIALERLFAATPRGAALINRIKNDGQLAHAEIRVISHSGDFSRTVSPGPAPSPAPSSAAARGGAAPISAPAAVSAEPAVPLDWRGTRRVNRYQIRPAVEIQLDGNPAVVVDLSHAGAQVLSATILRPNQKLRVSLPSHDFVMRFRGSVAWAQFELPNPTAAPRYRAGIEFADADPGALEAFCQKYKEPVSA